MSVLTFQIEDKELAQMQRVADAMHLSLDDLLRKIVRDYLKTEDEEFEEIMEFVLTKNHELYQRLA